jgi:hypothetical protein
MIAMPFCILHLPMDDCHLSYIKKFKEKKSIKRKSQVRSFMELLLQAMG